MSQHNGDWAYGPLMKAFAVLRPGCLWSLSRQNHKRRTVRLLTSVLTRQTRSSTRLCVKQRVVFSSLCRRCESTVTTAEQTKKRSMTTNLGSEVQKHTVQLSIIAIGAVKDKKQLIILLDFFAIQNFIVWSLWGHFCLCAHQHLIKISGALAAKCDVKPRQWAKRG